MNELQKKDRYILLHRIGRDEICLGHISVKTKRLFLYFNKPTGIV